MKRQIIKIDEAKCNGCGMCANACHEGAIKIIDGKAKLVREDFCDGLGDCLPACPEGAITFETREAPAYDEAAVKRAKEESAPNETAHGCCPALESFADRGGEASSDKALDGAADKCAGDCDNNSAAGPAEYVSRLKQWPCQIKLLPPKAPVFDGADLLIAADCTAYAYAGMHEEFMNGRITAIGCPKLDAVDYSEKLTDIIKENDIKSVTLLRMVVPCCGGIERAARKAIENSGKDIPIQVVTVSTDGKLL
ncbi:MAG: 4Fe-4S binding protein [Firmicutes bacterium]|nr:4Fe-4S binding protein [Bacillota bacterium]